MKKIKITKISMFLLITLLLSLGVSAFCAVRGYVYDSNGNPAENINVNIINLDNGVAYPTSVENGFYLQILHQCVIGQDRIRVVAWDDNNYAAEEKDATGSYTDIDLRFSGESQGAPASGGGGASAGQTEALIECNQIIIENNKPFEIGECDIGKYTYKGKVIDFNILSLQESLMQGIFSGLNSAIAVFVSQKKEFDIDNNKADDLMISFLSFDNGKATLIFESMEEVFPLEPVEAPVIEAPRFYLSPEAKAKLPTTLFTISLILIIIANVIWLVSQLEKAKKKR